ncbi:uncharacterized protein LOC116182151 [Photinus pyralis]|uniref:uncharacterized protein LOC116182151 n=1 Tax=Photinus pyralis TaxID=7054 RepID=UPI0012671E56|nr:uncharacterized protein LOC116182151 [Photinus pyralis]
MRRGDLVSGNSVKPGVSLADFLSARPTGLTEGETWAILCQAVQALQDLFLSDGASGGGCIPLVTPSTLLLSSRGRVKLYQNPILLRCGPPAHLSSYLAPEYRPTKLCSDTETEKMWIYGLGETLKRAALTSHAATSRLSGELCQVLTNMTRPHASGRASLMNLLDVISEYCKKRQQNRPFSHIVMDLHQEAMADLEMALESSWGLPIMPEIRSRKRTITETSTTTFNLPKPWSAIGRPNNTKPKLTKEASTSMEYLSTDTKNWLTPGTRIRPKSMCVPLGINHNSNYGIENPYLKLLDEERLNYVFPPYEDVHNKAPSYYFEHSSAKPALTRRNCSNQKQSKVRRNPVQRAASRLYHASDVPKDPVTGARDCVGPEFVVRATLPSKKHVLPDCKGNVRKNVTVILLNGQKLDISCNPNTTTAGQLFELIIQKEHIEENFMLGLSALIAGDFVFLPSDARICKAMGLGNAQIALTLFVRVRFFLPSLRAIRSHQARHMLYLQLRRCILEYQLPCTYAQLMDFGGLALQAEFGDYTKKEHGAKDYFLLEHYVPETVSCNSDEYKCLKEDLTLAHMTRRGLSTDRAEENFMILAQTFPHYGGHFYTAVWVLKDNRQKDVWLYISAQGINLYERNSTSHQWNLVLLEMFEWRMIQTLCYSKHYLCVLPHTTKAHNLKLKKYKLKMDHKKSYFTFRLASLHHQFFLRLRTQYASLQTLSEQFGVQLKDMKNETNSLCKLEALTNPFYVLDSAAVNAETEFKIEFCASPRASLKRNSDLRFKRSKSIGDFGGAHDDCLMIEEYQNKENENPDHGRGENNRSCGGLILDSSCLSGLPNSSVWDKRRGVKMGVSAFQSNGQRVSRSMEAVNALLNEELEQLSLQSTSLHCSSTSVSRSPVVEYREVQDAYILDSSIKSTGNQFLPDFQESLSASLLEKLNNISFAEECTLYSVTIDRDEKGSLGLQIMEGSDGKVYIQSVLTGGPAHLQGNIRVGDQIVAVNGRNLLSVKYSDALELLKVSGKKVEFVLSHISVNKNNIYNQATLPMSDLKSKNDTGLSSKKFSSRLKRMSYPNNITGYLQLGESLNLRCSPIEKHVTESCHDITNPNKSKADVPYHKHIRYGLEPNFHHNDSPLPNLNRNVSKSCTHIGENNPANNKAVIVDMIPKVKSYKCLRNEIELENGDVSHIPLPRSLGLSRKWRGPVQYPVTPVKKAESSQDDSSTYVTTSDEEQIFI